MQRLALMLVLALLSSFALSGIVHALVPHTHAQGSELLANSMHAALRTGEKILPLFSVLLFVLVGMVVQESRSYTFTDRALSRLQLHLYRGLEKYRRFR